MSKTKIVSELAQKCSLTYKEIIRPDRTRTISLFRYVIWLVFFTEQKPSLREMERLFYRHHSSILRGIRMAEGLLSINDRSAMSIFEKLTDKNLRL